jgi:hypothetical protein
LVTRRYDEWGNVALDGLHERFQHMSLPPDFEGNEELRDKLEGILAEDQDEDKMKSLEEFIEVGGGAVGVGRFLGFTAFGRPVLAQPCWRVWD